MADSIFDQLLTRLGVKMPAAPEVSPEQEALYRQVAEREQEKRPEWKKTISSGVEGAGNFLKGLGLSDPLTDHAQSLPEAAGMIIGTAGLPFGPKGIKGLYSRVEKIADSLPASVHPNKLGTILRNRASQEEVEWRGIDRLLRNRGDKQIKKEEFVEHLQQNPLDVKVKEYGGPPPDITKYAHRDPVTSNIVQDADMPNWTAASYGNYQMPGAQNYRETLIQLDKPAKLVEERSNWDLAKFDSGDFQSHHWEDPNVLVHVRHNEREIPPRPTISQKVHRDPKEYGGNYVGNIYSNSEHVASVIPRIPQGTPGAVPELKGRGDDLIQQMLLQVPSSSKGRMLENVQSDWHQRGAHSGYMTDIPTGTQTDITAATMEARQAYQEKLQEAAKAIGEWHPDYADTPEDILRPEDASFIWNRLAHEADQPATGIGLRQEQLRELQAQVRDAQTAYLQAQDAARRHASDAVPDAPFKDSWAELALKQQLLDVADRPDLDWIGIAPSSELRERGEVISPEFQDKQLPNSLEKLLKPFGGKVEQADLGFKRPRDVRWDAAEGRYGGYTEFDESMRQEPIVSMLPSRAAMRNPLREQEERQELIKALDARTPNIQAMIARLTPEMKAQIKEKGFPLLTLLAMLQAQQQSPETR